MKNPLQLLMNIVMLAVVLVFFVVSFATIGVFQLIVALFS